jgi:hypothetical protein
MFELLRRQSDGSLPPVKDDFIESFFAKHAPAVGSLVFQSAYPDGKPRKTGALAMWRGPEGVTIKVTDNEVEMCWQYSAEGFLDALKQLEKALQGGLPPNRSYETRSGRKKK